MTQRLFAQIAKPGFHVVYEQFLLLGARGRFGELRIDVGLISEPRCHLSIMFVHCGCAAAYLLRALLSSTCANCAACACSARSSEVLAMASFSTGIGVDAQATMPNATANQIPLEIRSW
jgi:hypothetical protein